MSLGLIQKVKETLHPATHLFVLVSNLSLSTITSPILVFRFVIVAFLVTSEDATPATTAQPVTVRMVRQTGDVVRSAVCLC